MEFKDLVEERKMSGYALSKASGLSRQRIAELIRGEVDVRDMALKNIIKLANGLGMTLYDLLDVMLK